MNHFVPWILCKLKRTYLAFYQIERYFNFHSHFEYVHFQAKNLSFFFEFTSILIIKIIIMKWNEMKCYCFFSLFTSSIIQFHFCAFCNYLTTSWLMAHSSWIMVHGLHESVASLFVRLMKSSLLLCAYCLFKCWMLNFH